MRGTKARAIRKLLRREPSLGKLPAAVAKKLALRLVEDSQRYGITQRQLVEDPTALDRAATRARYAE